MMRHLARSPLVQAAAVACASSAAILTWTLRGAMRLDPLPLATPSSVQLPVTLTGPAAQTSDALVEEAVNSDLFSPTRRPPTVSTAAPGAARAVAQTVPVQQSLRLVGTVVDSSSTSFVVYQLGTASPRVLHVGQRAGSYVLRSITQGGAVFVGDDGARIELRVPKTGS